MYCKHCGKVIADDSKYCRYCGKFLVEEVANKDKGEIVSQSSISEKVPKSDISEEKICINEIIAEGEDDISLNNASDTPITESLNEEKPKDDKPTSESKIMKVLGILSGILIWGIFGVFGLGLLAGLLFIIYMIIMMNMPNGMGVILFCVILGVTIFLIIKLIIKIIKGLRG